MAITKVLLPALALASVALGKLPDTEPCRVGPLARVVAPQELLSTHMAMIKTKD